MQESTPSRTALRVALRRAAHQLYDAEPLVYRDPFIVPLLRTRYREELERTPSARGADRPSSVGMRAWLVARSRLFADAVASSHPAAQQVLVLGAGLDTFALQHAASALRIFEVDHPATQQWKRELTAEAGFALPENATFVAVDFEHGGSLSQELARAGFDTHRPTAVSWLGVVPYLTDEAFRGTLRLLAKLPAGSLLVFDYGQPRHALSPVERREHDSLAARVALAGEPFLLSFMPGQARDILAESGFTVLEDFGATQLNARFFTGRQDDLRLRDSAVRMLHAVRI